MYVLIYSINHLICPMKPNIPPSIVAASVSLHPVYADHHHHPCFFGHLACLCSLLLGYPDSFTILVPQTLGTLGGFLSSSTSVSSCLEGGQEKGREGGKTRLMARMTDTELFWFILNQQRFGECGRGVKVSWCSVYSLYTQVYFFQIVKHSEGVKYFRHIEFWKY